MMANKPQLSYEKIEKYNLRVPRYTSYPTVPNWGKQEFGHKDYLAFVDEIANEPEPISIYIHIPFCERRCLFCACNTIITQRPERSERYLEYLLKEINTIADHISDRREVIQFHLGGGTPTHFSANQLDILFTHIEDKFVFDGQAERSIEVHPSVTEFSQVDILIDHQFNRLSMGVQDFDPVVQENLNRYQSYEETVELIEYGRDAGFEGINLDLIYGLPYQSPQGFQTTLEKVVDIKPDRIALYSYAHFPQIFRHHKGIPLDVVPSGNDKMQLFLDAREQLLGDEYSQIGFDHFALQTDELWTSFQNKGLRRNFMGFTTKAGTDLVAFGWSGISELSNSYAQNSKSMDEYEALIDKYGVATIKGYAMTEDDKIRKKLIMEILCQGEINIPNLEQQFGKSLDMLHQEAKQKLPEFEQTGFVVPTSYGWKLTDEGNIFARVVAASFDAYLKGKHLFSTSV